MKTILLFIATFLTINLFGQAPAGFNYQAVLRDGSGNLKVNTAVTLRIDILQGSASGTIVYAESFASSTNSFGLVNLQVGKGSVISGTFSAINWSAGSYFMKVSVDGTEMGTSQLLSVPYALHAGSVANGFSGNYNDLSYKPTIINTTLNNTSTGYNTLLNNTIGFNNTAIGIFALSHNTAGDQNTAVGTDALYSNTIGRVNSAYGEGSLYHNINGHFNVAVGGEALYYNTSGNYNTACGMQVLWNNTTGYHNTAYGAYSLYMNKEGYNNTTIGYEALWHNESRDNSALGYQALYSNTSGYENVAIGANSLSSNTTGNANTAIGKNALTSSATGTLNTAIGCYSDIAQGLSNATAIGNGAYVSASDKIVLGNGSVNSIGGYAAWTNYSDRRLKENIVYTNKMGLNFITRLKPASYNYIKDTNKRRRDGLIAQDVEQTLNDLGIDFSGLIVDDDKDKTLNLSYAEFVIPLVTAVQELNAKNHQLEQNNKTIEASLNEMKAEIEKLKQLIQKK